MSEENPDNCSFVSIHYIICECGETFPSEDALKAHLEKEHPHKRERKEYKCGICYNIYNTEDECIQHYEASHLPVGINLDHCETEDSEDYEDEKKFILDEDEKKYIIETDEKKHILGADELEEGETEDDEMHPEYEALEEAIESLKEETLDESEIPVEDGDGVVVKMEGLKPPRRRRRKFPKTDMSKKQRIIVCEVCGKYYASNAALRYHQRTHTGERPYQCNLCPKTFAMPLFLQIHVRTHTGERPYQCPACPKAFSNKAALLRHDRVHSGEKPYKCPVCGKGFTQSNSMKLHVTTVHLKQPTPYKSKNRRLQAEERSQEQGQTNRRTFPNRRKMPCTIDSADVLRNGLESYVLGPLKADLQNLKADIHLMKNHDDPDSSQDEKVYQMHESIVYEMKDNSNVFEVIEEVLYEDADGNCEVVSSREC